MHCQRLKTCHTVVSTMLEGTMNNTRRLVVGIMFGVAVLCPVFVLAGFAGTDVFLPMAGRQAGAHPSNDGTPSAAGTTLP